MRYHVGPYSKGASDSLRKPRNPRSERGEDTRALSRRVGLAGEGLSLAREIGDLAHLQERRFSRESMELRHHRGEVSTREVHEESLQSLRGELREHRQEACATVGPQA